MSTGFFCLQRTMLMLVPRRLSVATIPITYGGKPTICARPSFIWIPGRKPSVWSRPGRFTRQPRRYYRTRNWLRAQLSKTTRPARHESARVFLYSFILPYSLIGSSKKSRLSCKMNISGSGTTWSNIRTIVRVVFSSELAPFQPPKSARCWGL